jgi:hypothetical protein
MSRPKRNWPALVGAQVRSGQLMETFCRARGVSVWNLYLAISA